jgi:hypothetical protein
MGSWVHEFMGSWVQGDPACRFVISTSAWPRRSRGYSLRGGMRLEAVIAAGMMPARLSLSLVSPLSSNIS